MNRIIYIGHINTNLSSPIRHFPLVHHVDSEYESDSSTTTDIIEEICFDDLEEEEIDFMEHHVLELLEVFIKTNESKMAGFMASPRFFRHIVDEITTQLLDEWESYSFIFDESEMREFVEETFHQWIQMYPIFIPRQGYDSRFATHSSIESLQDKITHLQNCEQHSQRSQGWYEQRYNLLTASNIWKAISTPSMFNSLVYEKCKPFTTFIAESNRSQFISVDSPLHWGVKYEPLTSAIYQDKNTTTLGEFGCIVHPKYPFLGASPDGINIDLESPLYGRMVEIKNIVNRIIDGIPLVEYWIQMQIQMEVCDLDECDFVETKFREYATEEEWLMCDHEYKGVMLRCDQNKYEYMPLDYNPTEWKTWMEKLNRSEQPIFWSLEHYSCVYVQRNREWFQYAIPHIEDCWNTIVKERVEGYEHRQPKKKVHTEVIQTTDNTYSVNLQLGNKVCLIKLDHD